MMTIKVFRHSFNINSSQFFTVSILLVNAGNYLYNLILGNLLGPNLFADAAFLITLLLIFSFLGMTFQLVCTKYSIQLSKSEVQIFRQQITKIALLFGSIFSLCFLSFSTEFSELFNLKNSEALIIFGFSIPLYFILSINRGFLQGNLSFIQLSYSYLWEMLGRLAFTFLFIIIFKFHPNAAIAISILISFIMGMIPIQKNNLFSFKSLKTINSKTKKTIYQFALITLSYELSQILINNSDIVLVKYFFNATDSGLYASLALIGRAVYFKSWMLIMLLLPKVISAKKNGTNYQAIFYRYMKYIGLSLASIVLICIGFHELIVQILFGEAYISISPLLYQYAIATTLFALANMFVYYFLSLSKYLPVLTAIVFGILQVIAIYLFHTTLEEVVRVQIILMSILFLYMLIYFIKMNKKI